MTPRPERLVKRPPAVQKNKKKHDLASLGSNIDPSLTFYPYISHYPLFILYTENFVIFIFILPLTHTHNFIFIFRRYTFREPLGIRPDPIGSRYLMGTKLFRTPCMDYTAYYCRPSRCAQRAVRFPSGRIIG